MCKYILQRIVAAFFTLLAIIVVIFFVLRYVPGNYNINSSQIDPAIDEVVEEKYYLNSPLITQFFYTMRDYLRLDFGYSQTVRPGTKVFDVVLNRLPVTVQLNYFSALFMLPAGLFFGITMAVKKNTPYDHIAGCLVILLISVPPFVQAAVMQYVLGFKLEWFPIVLANESSLSWTKFYSMILPILALSFTGIANMARMLRAELAEVLTSDFMLLAKAKGLSYRQTLLHHALRSACVPLVSTFQNLFLNLVSNSLVIEQIFSVPGLSKTLLQAINGKDHYLTTGIAVFYAAIGLAATIVVDITYGLIDPRIRVGGKKTE